MNIKKLFISILTFLSLTLTLKAQQEAQFTQYMQNYFLVNPAEGGTEEFVKLQAGYRTQWLGLEGAPSTFFVSAHSPLGKKTSRFEDVRQRSFHGIGGYVLKDQIGPTSRTSAYGSYAFHLPVSAHNDLVISVGANFGVKQIQLAGDDIQFYSEVVDGIDEQAISGNQTRWVPDVTAGLWAYSNHYFVGVSMFQLLQNELTFSTTDQASGTSSIQSDRLDPHLFVTGGYKLDVTEDIALVPSVVVKWVSPAPAQWDLNAKVAYKNWGWGGVSYRFEDAIIAMAGTTVLNGFVDISYSYDFNTSTLNSFNSGSHEIVLGYNVPYKEQPPPPSQFW